MHPNLHHNMRNQGGNNFHLGQAVPQLGGLISAFEFVFNLLLALASGVLLFLFIVAVLSRFPALSWLLKMLPAAQVVPPLDLLYLAGFLAVNRFAR